MNLWKFSRPDGVKTFCNTRDIDAVLARVQRIKPTTPRCWGKMTAPQMICHLNDAFKLYMGAISTAPAGFPYPSKLLKWGCLWIPLRWPRNFRTIAEVDQQRGGTIPSEFERDVAELNTLVHQFAKTSLVFEWPSHPYLGRMTHGEWMRLGYLHTDHHLRQFGE